MVILTMASVHREPQQHGNVKGIHCLEEIYEPTPKRPRFADDSIETIHTHESRERNSSAVIHCNDAARAVHSPYLIALHKRSAFVPVGEGKPSVSPSSLLMPPPPPVPRPTHSTVHSSPTAEHTPVTKEHSETKSRSDFDVDDAMTFVRQVKKAFESSPRLYKEFLGIMKQYRLHEIDTPTVIDCASRLFRGRPELIRGFNIFLPEESQISADDSGVPEETSNKNANPMSTLAVLASVQPTVSDTSHNTQKVTDKDTKNESLPDQPQSTPTTGRALVLPTTHSKEEINHALSFVAKVKQRFPDGETHETFRQFISVLRKFQANTMGLEEVASQVSLLFADHTDLMEAFIYFLPDKMRENAKKHLRRASPPKESPHLASINFGKCVVCWDRQTTHTFVPCGHLCACAACASRNMLGPRSCPVCLQRAAAVTKVLLS